jgi:hypothetical protein
MLLSFCGEYLPELLVYCALLVSRGGSLRGMPENKRSGVDLRQKHFHHKRYFFRPVVMRDAAGAWSRKDLLGPIYSGILLSRPGYSIVFKPNFSGSA